MSVEKRATRRTLRDRRHRLSATFVEAAGETVWERIRSFPPYVVAVSVIAYVADDNEVPTTALLEAARGSGLPIYLPRTTEPVGLIRWHPGDPWSIGAGGIKQPAEGLPTEPETPAIAFIPVVGWDETGTRLGRGGGFYDRLFASRADGIVRVGLAYESLRFPELPRDPWDVPLHYVITEQRIVRCGGADLARPEQLQKGGLQL
jgi:5-formyltetrahydrofolate cyclo-ligase